jgi:phage-related tail protein
LSEKSPQKERNPEKIKRSLDEVVHRLNQESGSSQSWGETMSENRVAWEDLKTRIQERQRALKALVREKKAGTISTEEFEKRYKIIQDELTELEFKVYNLRLGTSIKA